ncbi:MAG: hypothetical protein JXQ90_17320 [Cyclobacteriaceae bacterium]
MRSIFFLIGILLTCRLAAQEGAIADMFKVDYDTPLTIELKTVEELDEDVAPVVKEEKINPKIFWDIKTKRGYIKQKVRTKVVHEMFFYLKKKDFSGPGEFDKDFYYYDKKKRKIVNSTSVADPTKVGVMHGHYLKKVGEQIVEEGYFYKGKKHGRWVRLNESDILMDKNIYWKGWPQQSLLSFYDPQKTQLREVIPVKFGERDGVYYAFHANGNVAATGLYKYNMRIGTWREFYPNAKPKREITYPQEPFENRSTIKITREWARDGRIIHDLTRKRR